MNTIEVSNYSEYILNNKKNIDVELGKIHTIFNKSLNLDFDFGLVNIIEESDLKLPFSIEVNKSTVEYIISNSYIDDIVSINYKSKKLIFNNINLELSLSKKPYECSLDKGYINEKDLEKNLNIVLNFINNSSIENGFGIPNKEFTKYLLQTKDNKVEFYESINKLRNLNLNNSELENIFNYFIGRGSGLTPSGDDLMLGLISFLKVIDKDNISKKLYLYLNKCGSKRTTDISLEYLKYACFGKVGSLTKNLCEVTVSNNLYIEKYLEELSKKGHTSGIDTILGIFIGMLIELETKKIKI